MGLALVNLIPLPRQFLMPINWGGQETCTLIPIIPPTNPGFGCHRPAAAAADVMLIWAPP
ncbi:sphingomyelin phosphodiesterase [Moniliophthora roreri]|nr:sphingomyelin phosphodiesterase [Moniliophthora roreri]